MTFGTNDKKTVTNPETLFFIKELGRLINDFRNCADENLRDSIYKDIKLLCLVIY